MLYTNIQLKSVHSYRMKKISEGFLPNKGMAAHLGHMTSIMFMDFHFFVHESLQTKFG